MANDLWGASDLNLSTMETHAPNLVVGGGFEVAKVEKCQLVAPDSVANLNGYGGPSIHPMTGLGAPFGKSGNYSYTSGWDDTTGFYKVAIGIGDGTAMLPSMLLPCAIVIDNCQLQSDTDFILQFKQKFVEIGQYSVTLALYGGYYRAVITYNSADFIDGNVSLPVKIPVHLYNEVIADGYDIDSSPMYHSGLTIFINGNFNPGTPSATFTRNGFPNTIGHVSDIKSPHLYIKEIDFFAGEGARTFTPATIGEVRLAHQRYSRVLESKAKGLVIDHVLRIPPHPEMIRRRKSTPAIIECLERPAQAPAVDVRPTIAITKHPIDSSEILTEGASIHFLCVADSTYTNQLKYTWYNAVTKAVIKTSVGTNSRLDYVRPSGDVPITYSAYCKVEIPNMPHIAPVYSNVGVAILRTTGDKQPYTPPVHEEVLHKKIDPTVIKPKPVNLIQMAHTGAFKSMDFATGISYTDEPLIYSHPPIDAMRNSVEYPWICDVRVKAKTTTTGVLTLDVDFYIADLGVDLSQAEFIEHGTFPCRTGSHFPTAHGTYVGTRISSDYLYQIVTARWTTNTPADVTGVHSSGFYINYGRTARSLRL